MSDVVIELVVRDHPGAMSHVTGLFARRAYNLERIVCSPLPGGGDRLSRIVLLVRERDRLAQLMNDLARLYDVRTVRRRDDWAPDAFARIDRILD